MSNFRLLAPRTKYRPRLERPLASQALVSEEGASSRMEQPALLTVETTARWGAVARSPRSDCCTMFVPLITSEAHAAYAGADQPTNNTAELSGFVEALQFLSTQ